MIALVYMHSLRCRGNAVGVKLPTVDDISRLVQANSSSKAKRRKSQTHFFTPAPVRPRPGFVSPVDRSNGKGQSSDPPMEPDDADAPFDVQAAQRRMLEALEVRKREKEAGKSPFFTAGEAWGCTDPLGLMSY